MQFFVARERHPDERRVSASPETVERLIEAGHQVAVEAGAGAAASFSDRDFETVGATIVQKDSCGGADFVLKVGPISEQEIEELGSTTTVIGLLDPFNHLTQMKALALRGASSFALELLPRITRAQAMDALSSQASIAGYKAVLVAASRLGRYFPLMMTAAGTVPPAKVVVIGAGVAGLQAVATAKRLGAVVEVSDIRPAVKEQVESLGGRFIKVPELEESEDAGGYAKEMGEDFLARQRELLAQHIAAANVLITTAQIPGKAAPRIVSREMIEDMRPGSVVVDLAASSGGNCELTRSGEDVVHEGVVILGPPNLAATMAHDASVLYARNVLALVEHLTPDGVLSIDDDDEIVAGALVTHGGKVVHEGLRTLIEKAS